MKLYDDVNNIPKGSIKDNEEDLVTNISNNVVTHEYLNTFVNGIGEGYNSEINENIDMLSTTITTLDAKADSINNKANELEVSRSNIKSKLDTISNSVTDLSSSVTNIDSNTNEISKEIQNISNPLDLHVKNEGNNFTVGVDSSGTKYNNIESNNTEITLNGQTLVNLWGNKPSDFKLSNGASFENGIITVNADGNWINFHSYRMEMFKPSTNYTVIVNVIENTLDGTVYITSNGNGDYSIINEEKVINSGEKGLFIFSVNTFSSFDGGYYSLRSYVNNDCTSGSIKLSIIVLEGNYTNVPIEYFEGLKSSAETNENKLEIKSVGKNLINVTFNDLLIGNNLDGNSGELITSYFKHMSCTKDYKRINIKGNCVLSYTTNDTHYLEKMLFYDKNYNYISNSSLNYKVGGDNITLTIPNNAYYYKLTFRDNLGVTDGKVLNEEIFNKITVQLEEGATATQYEPYKESISTIQLSEPLRSLPNGVKDEIFVHDDKVVVTRNVGQYILDGIDETYTLESHTTSTDILRFNAYAIGLNNKEYVTYGISDYFKHAQDNSDTEHFRYSLAPNFKIWISSSKLPSADAIGMKKWITDNKPKFLYELDEPTYEWFELPSPHLYKDGHVFIESGAVPISDSEHTVTSSLISVVNANTNAIWNSKNMINNTNKSLNDIASSISNITARVEALETSTQETSIE